jgi:Mg/Co/Ni transporter MgtE
VVLADAEDVEATLIGHDDLLDEILHALRGRDLRADLAEAVQADLHGGMMPRRAGRTCVGCRANALKPGVFVLDTASTPPAGVAALVAERIRFFMLHRSRRAIALLGTTAALAGGSLATITAAATAADPQRIEARGLLDGLLSGLLGQIVGATVGTIQGIISGLTPTQVGDLIENAAPADLPNLLTAAQNNNQLVPALGTLTPTETGDVIAPLSGSGLTTLLGGLNLTQLTNSLGTLNAVETAGLLDSATSAQLTTLLGGLTGTQLSNALGTLTPTQAGDLLAPLAGGNLSSLLGVLNTTQLTSILSTLTSGELASVVDGLTAGQTGSLLSVADATQLTNLLGALTSGQLSGALTTLDPAALTSIVGGLTPSQITGLLGAGGSSSVIDGLLGTATGLAGTSDVSDINGLIGQVTALLGGGTPAVGDLSDVASLLGILNPLLATAGLDTARLSSLLTTVDGLLAAAVPAPLSAPLHDIVTTVTNVLNPPPGGGTTPPPTGGTTTPPPGGTTTTPVTTTTVKPGTTTVARPAETGTQVAAKPGPFRATIGRITLSRKRTSMKFTLSCPASAPKGCLVQLSAKIAGQKAIRTTTVALASGKSSPVTVTLSKSTTKRLKKKGGSLQVTAKTALSTLAASTQTVKVKKPKTKRKSVKR